MRASKHARRFSVFSRPLQYQPGPDTAPRHSTTVRYHYDPLGNRLRTELPDGGVLEQLYDGSGHLHRISYNGETVSDLERDALHKQA